MPNSACSAAQLSLGLAPAHRNHYLFSDPYLNALLPADSRWQGARAEAEDLAAWRYDRYALTPAEQNVWQRVRSGQLGLHKRRTAYRALPTTFR